METIRAKNRKGGSDKVTKGVGGPRKKFEADERHNRKRREAYHTDPSYREAVTKRVKDAYYKDRELPPSPLAGGPRTEPVEVELYSTEDDSAAFVAEAYNIPQAAVALGKNPLTVKRWIKVGMLPAPVYADTSHGYRHYLAEEVEAIAEELHQHHLEYQYFRENHTQTIANIRQRLQRHGG